MYAFRVGIKSKDDMRRYSLEELENMCPKEKRLYDKIGDKAKGKVVFDRGVLWNSQ